MELEFIEDQEPPIGRDAERFSMSVFKVPEGELPPEIRQQADAVLLANNLLSKTDYIAKYGKLPSWASE
jgi:hypothetical protein